jgi:hypothetical protein|tara:strand:+ start:90 stop:422 length:333 start_codon:yes stop_codon:yes gene_type:complete
MLYHTKGGSSSKKGSPMRKNNLTNKTKSIQLYSDSGKFLLERFYRVMEQGFLVDPLTLPSHTEYYTWVALREKFPCRRLKLGEVCKLLREEGYTDSKGILKSKEGEDQPT